LFQNLDNMNVEEQLERFLTVKPKLGRAVYVARGAVLAGDVTLGDYASIWYNAVLRADIDRIEVGHHSNVQDNSVIHLADDKPCILGNYVTVGHSAIIHACTIKDETLVGMGATVLDGAVIGERCLIGARSLITQGTIIPPHSLVMGSPAKVVRQLSDQEASQLKYWAEKYVRVAAWCFKNNYTPPPLDLDPEATASIASQAQVAGTPCPVP
jgi:carbonic anhydrase/acetyltransferase-like protein (isoleucine patch superfamily)